MADGAAPTLSWPGRGRPVELDPVTGRWRFAEQAAPARTIPAFDGNLLIHGEAAGALSALAASHARQIQLCYIDPPFNTGNEFAHYDDRTTHAVWLSGLEERVLLAHALLAPGGFFVAHINVVEQAYLKVLLDEIFGRDQLVAQIAWQRAPDRIVLGQGRSLIADHVEYLLCYVREKVAPDWPRPERRAPLGDAALRTYGRVLHPSAEADLVDEFIDVAGGTVRIFAHRSHRLERAPAAAFVADFPHRMRVTNQQTESTFQHKLLARMPSKTTLYRAEYTQRGGKHVGPRARHYLGGNVVLWLRDVAELVDGKAIRVADLNNFWPADEIPATGLAREGGVAFRRGKKPERLLERVIAAFSRPGDRVLDFFAGSGTTGAVAHRLGRRFILVEAGATAHEMTAPRLQRAGAHFTTLDLR